MIEKGVPASSNPPPQGDRRAIVDAAEAAFTNGKYREARRLIAKAESTTSIPTAETQTEHQDTLAALKRLKEKLKPEPLNIFLLVLSALLLLTITCATYLDAF